ncbi:MAG: type II toxin-antitoxin system RelE/ParE family toxin [Clostridiales Family XIII bacterium]|jgi:plasmid stabilization system protein ParE|nr:type II toxin-antitoxin system RelE/ParE family toxin [Clostridiales Family XIII bacterium]
MSSGIYKVRVSTQAYYALDAHIEFLSRVSPKAAATQKKKLFAKISNLGLNPYRHPVFDADPDMPEYRKMVIDRYIILYLINEKDKAVEVDLVWDSRMDNLL